MTLVRIPANIPVIEGGTFSGKKFTHPAQNGAATEKSVYVKNRGTVPKYAPTYKGQLIEPVATNYLLNSASPVTQTTGRLATGDYCLSCVGSGTATVSAGTATITGGGEATESAPKTLTVTGAGAGTVTVSGTLTHFQLEAGTSKTSRIDTTTDTATRPTDIVSRQWIYGNNDFAVAMRVNPLAVGQSAYLLGMYTNADNSLSVSATATAIIFTKRVGGVVTTVTVAYTHATGKPVDVLIYQLSTVGMGIAVREYSGGEWSALTWADADTTTAKSDAAVTAAYQIGARDGTGQFYANYPWTQVLKVPSRLQTHAAVQTWLAAEVAP